MPAVAAAAVVAGGAILGSKQQSDAIKDASRRQGNATQASIQAERDALMQQRQDLAPFRNMIGASRGSKSPLPLFRQMAVNQEDYSYAPESDPLLNNALSRISRSVMDAQAAQGKLGSGSTLNSLIESMAPIYMQRQGQLFDQRYNANNQQFNQLQTLIGMAQNAAAGQGTATANTANNITNLTTNNANAQAAAGIAQANNQANMLNNLIGAGMMAYGAYNKGAQ